MRIITLVTRAELVVTVVPSPLPLWTTAALATPLWLSLVSGRRTSKMPRLGWLSRSILSRGQSPYSDILNWLPLSALFTGDWDGCSCRPFYLKTQCQSVS